MRWAAPTQQQMEWLWWYSFGACSKMDLMTSVTSSKPPGCESLCSQSCRRRSERGGGELRSENRCEDAEGDHQERSCLWVLRDGATAGNETHLVVFLRQFSLCSMRLSHHPAVEVSL